MEQILWSISENTLIISGVDSMSNYHEYTPNHITTAPWGSRSNFITAVNIEKGIISIGDCAFLGCRNLMSASISDSVSIIGALAFAYCDSLAFVSIPNSVQHIGNSAFHGCKSLMSIIIPDSVLNIGTFAFADCCGLTEIINHATKPQKIEPNVFKGINKANCTLRIPAEAITKYTSIEGWHNFRIMPI